jgi:ribosomal protein L33
LALRHWPQARLNDACLQNKKNTPERLELMKYNKYLRRQTLHREIK